MTPPPPPLPPPAPRGGMEVPLAVLAGSVAYVGTLLALVFVGPAADRPSLAAMLQPPERAVWCSLIAGQAALWAVMLAPLLQKLAEHGEALRAHRRGALTLLAGLMLLFWIFMASHQGLSDRLTFPVAWQKPKIALISVLGFVPMLLSLLGIYAVSAAAGTPPRTGDGSTAEVLGFLKLRRDMRTFATMAGLIIGGATLTTGALHRALVALNEGRFTYNPSLVLLYGAFGTAVIALVYVPAHLQTNRLGHEIVRRLVADPAPGASAATLVAWRAEREALEGMMELKTSVAESLKGSVSLLYPLAGSAISVLLGIGK